MIKEFLRPKEYYFSLGEGKELETGTRQPLKVMDHPELLRGPLDESPNSSSSEYDGGHCRKRKHIMTFDQLATHTGIELHLNHPLPFDWEQCLDLQLGRMYYMNRKTLKKSWVRPKEQKKVDLDLNISTTLLPTEDVIINPASAAPTELNPTGGMVAAACANCHLLVMLCRSSPSCPNCKFVHTLTPPPRIKPLETLSLLH